MARFALLAVLAVAFAVAPAEALVGAGWEQSFRIRAEAEAAEDALACRTGHPGCSDTDSSVVSLLQTDLTESPLQHRAAAGVADNEPVAVVQEAF
mmetsp:Transcript_46880/g.144846  ORF Transcript_46880/g.144846 Transcript_46880/m.144846 type:complete len:95 (-) Transcript_46880:272-556(-)